MAKLTEEERQRLSDQLVRLGDFLAEDDEYGQTRREVERDYRRTMYLLYPETRPKRPKLKQIEVYCENCNKSQKNRIRETIKTVRFHCSCGHVTEIKTGFENLNKTIT